VNCRCCSNDVTEKGSELSVESDEDDRVQPVSKFGLLNIEDASGSDSEPDSDTVSSAAMQTKNKKQSATVKEDDKVTSKASAKKQGNKGKAGTKKSKDEENIDELLAELEAPKNVKSGEKKEKKKKKGGNVEDVGEADASTQPVISAAAEPEIDYRNMTQEEIAKLMEEQYGEDSEEERKKAKGKKKMRKAKNDIKQTENGDVEIMSGKITDKPTAQVGQDDDKKVDADDDAEIADNMARPTKKHNKRTQQKQAEVYVVVFCVITVL